MLIAAWELKWFGDPEPRAYTSNHESWHYVEAQTLPKTDATLATLLDMRIPLTFSESDCTLIGAIIAECFEAVCGATAPAELGAA